MRADWVWSPPLRVSLRRRFLGSGVGASSARCFFTQLSLKGEFRCFQRASPNHTGNKITTKTYCRLCLTDEAKGIWYLLGCLHRIMSDNPRKGIGVCESFDGCRIMARGTRAWSEYNKVAESRRSCETRTRLRSKR